MGRPLSQELCGTLIQDPLLSVLLKTYPAFLCECTSLSVAENNNKKRSILNFSFLIRYIWQEQATVENQKVAPEYLMENLFSVKISMDFAKFTTMLIFPRKPRHVFWVFMFRKKYCFSVLPLGLSMALYALQKV